MIFVRLSSPDVNRLNEYLMTTLTCHTSGNSKLEYRPDFVISAYEACCYSRARDFSVNAMGMR